jgi:hypothetical protein
LSCSCHRTKRGAITPLVAFCVLVIAAFLALSIDIMRNALAVRKLQFAAEAAALHALSTCTDESGNYNPGDAETRVRTALQTSGGEPASAFNSAPIGPVHWKDAPYNSGVTFGSADVILARNPADNNELWVQITAARRGNDALRMAFLPMVLAMNARDGEQLPPNAYQVEPWRTSEVVGQPASRIGEGAPRAAAGAGGRAREFAGHAVFPLGITWREFQLLAAPSATRTRYAVDLQASASPSFNQPAMDGHLRGYFVNVTADGGADYYGSGSGSLAVEQLLSNLRYFRGTVGSDETPPAAVERGSRLAWFDQADASVAQRKPQIMAVLRQIPLRNYVMPILQNDPQVGVRNAVVGFARLRLAQTINSTGSDIEILIDVAESVPVRNASSATGMASVPPLSLTQLPAPVAPFGARPDLGASDALAPRPRSVALAPALSARQFRVTPTP